MLDYPAPGSVRLGWDYDNTGQPTRLTLTDPAADEPTLAATTGCRRGAPRTGLGRRAHECQAHGLDRFCILSC